MNPAQASKERLQNVLPSGFPLQKCKCKCGKAPGTMSVDLVVRSLDDMPIRSVPLVKLKAMSSFTDLIKAPFHTDGLLLGKKLKLSGEELVALKRSWSVLEVFDFRNPDTKKMERARKKKFQAMNTGDLNKVVINSNCKVAKKAKAAFSDSLLPMVLTLAEESRFPKQSVDSWKFVVDFKDAHKDEFPRFLESVCRSLDNVKTKKCTFSTEQAALVEAAKAERAARIVTQ